MRVLFLTNNPHTGSTARVLLEWLALSSGNCLLPAVGLQQRGELEQQIKVLDVPHRVLAMPWPDRRHAWQVSRALLAGAWWARQLKTELIHCQEHDVYPFGRMLARILRVPIACHVQFLVERGFCEWAFGGSRRPDALVWTSKQQRHDCQAATLGIVDEAIQFTIPMGLDVARYAISGDRRSELRHRWGIGPQQIAVGAASAIRDRKQIHAFIDLLVALRARNPNVIGVFAGGAVPDEREYAAKVEPRLKALDAEGVLRWVGHLEPVEPFYHAIDVFVSTSLYETFGMSVCEAMACGKPVVGYCGGSVAEVVGDTGIIVENGDLEALTRAVGRLAADEALRMEMGRKALRVATAFNPQQSLAQLEAVYRGILARN